MPLGKLSVLHTLFLENEEQSSEKNYGAMKDKKDKEQHPFHVKSDWEPPVQPSVALETYLEEVKSQEITCPPKNVKQLET